MAEDFTYQYSFKLNGLGGGQGYSMVNVRAGAADDFEAALDAMPDDSESGAPGLLTKLLEIDRLVAATGTVASTPASQPAQARPAAAAPATAAFNPEFIHQQPPGPAPLDNQGQPLVWLSAKVNSGKNWKGWFSAHRKGEPGWQEPKFVR